MLKILVQHELKKKLKESSSWFGKAPVTPDITIGYIISILKDPKETNVKSIAEFMKSVDNKLDKEVAQIYLDAPVVKGGQMKKRS